MEEKQDLKIYYFEQPTGYRSIKSEIIIDKPLAEVFRYVQLRENNLIFNKDIECLNEIRAIDERYSLQYVKYKESRGISSRDVVRICYTDLKNDKGIIFYTSDPNTKVIKQTNVKRIEVIVI